MTRAHLGLLAPLPPRLHRTLRSRALVNLHVPGVLARLGLMNTVTLTPEGVTAKEQVKLIRTLVGRGCRTFVMHYHSPSLVPGHTPYVTTDTDLQEFLTRLKVVCRFFFKELGGMSGNPPDLLPQSMRERVLPPAGSGHTTRRHRHDTGAVFVSPTELPAPGVQAIRRAV
jgi:hypothetical protein